MDNQSEQMFSIAENLATAVTSLILIAREATERAEQITYPQEPTTSVYLSYEKRIASMQERIDDLEEKIKKEKRGQSEEIELYKSEIANQQTEIETQKVLIENYKQVIEKQNKEIDFLKKQPTYTTLPSIEEVNADIPLFFKSQDNPENKTPSEEKSNPETNPENHCLVCNTVIPSHRKVCSTVCRAAYATKKAKESKATTTEETENQGK
jgi:predicted nucleic acid-binding Zn ribbon protein/chromosome segregation ATPase